MFHSLVGQLCLTTPLVPHRLRKEVKAVLNQTRAGVAPAAVVARLFAHMSLAGGTEWIPEVSQVSWNLPGPRVSLHSDSNFALSTLGGEPSLKLESIELPSPKTPVWLGRVQEASRLPSAIQIVFQSMLGNITVVCDAPRSAGRDLVMEKVLDPALRQKPSALAGSILHALWQNPKVLASMEIDVGYPAPSPDTLWLRHLSGETCAYVEGVDPLPERWEIVGKGFLGPHIEKHLRFHSQDPEQHRVSAVFLEDAVG